MNGSGTMRTLTEKQAYDIIKRLMKLADNDENEKFISIINENYQSIFQDPELLKIDPGIIIAAGLIARNKSELLKYFTEKLDEENFAPNYSDELVQLAGILILEKKNTEAINYFLEKNIELFDLLQSEFILTAIIAADNLTLFRTVYNIRKDITILRDTAFYGRRHIHTSPFEIAVLEGVIFESKNILDYVTDNGNAFRYPEALEKVNFLTIQELSYAYSKFYPQYNGRCMPEVCWLEKLYSIYFKNEPPEDAYAHLTKTAEKINIIKYSTSDFLNCIEDANSINSLLRLEIARICGMKTNDLSFIAYYRQDYPLDCINFDYIAGLLSDVAGNAPYVDFTASEFGMYNVGNIPLFADKIPGGLTVRLICGFSGGRINELRETVRLELDISESRTADYLRKALYKPSGTRLTSKDPVFELIDALIGEKLVDPQSLIKLVDTVKCPQIVNYLFNFNKNRE